MKHVLLASATTAEIGSWLEQMAPFRNDGSSHSYTCGDLQIRVCITGVGMMAAAFALGRELAQQHYDLAIQAGIGGSFDRSLALGTLAAVISEEQGDLGAEDREQFIDIFQLGFADKNTFPYRDGRLYNPAIPAFAADLRQVSSLTVNTVSGHLPTIAQRAARHGCTLESMEGAAFHYACLVQETPFIQLRAISNYVEPRNRAGWDIPAALRALNGFLAQQLGPGNTLI